MNVVRYERKPNKIQRNIRYLTNFLLLVFFFHEYNSNWVNQNGSTQITIASHFIPSIVEEEDEANQRESNYDADDSLEASATSNDVDDNSDIDSDSMDQALLDAKLMALYHGQK